MLLSLISWIFQIFYILILARVIVSWIRVDPYHPIVRFIYNATEPLLAPIRQLLPPAGGLDFSPLILLVGISVLRMAVFSIL
ncbi:MAG: YggT family protein [Ardenticatenaceae bacterium]|nr:YggT family protein [Ardenticatenaceae bacterium]